MTNLEDAAYRLQRIAAWHSRGTLPGGMVYDYCIECDNVWPCDTRRMADGTYPDDDEGLRDAFNAEFLRRSIEQMDAGREDRA